MYDDFWSDKNMFNFLDLCKSKMRSFHQVIHIYRLKV